MFYSCCVWPCRPFDFVLSDFDFPIQVFPHFGLLSSGDSRWTEFWNIIDNLNTQGQGSTFYKVLFLGRHGEAVRRWLKLLVFGNSLIHQTDDIAMRIYTRVSQVSRRIDPTIRDSPY
jgi:hypothetical protein